MMRSKIWSKIILFICFCIIPKYSVVCINFEGDDDSVDTDLTNPGDSSFGPLGDLMLPNFADYFLSERKENPDNSDSDSFRYNKGKAEDDDEDFRSHIGNVYEPSPAKNIFDVLKFASDINEADSSNEEHADDMNDQINPQSIESSEETNPSLDKSIGGLLEKAASIKESISRLIGIGSKSSTVSPDEADRKSDINKKDDDEDEDDDDDSEDGESNSTISKKNDKSAGNIFTKWFSKSKPTTSGYDDKATNETGKTQVITEDTFTRNLTTAKDDDEEEEDDDDEVKSDDNSTSHTSSTKSSSISTTVTPLSLSTTDSRTSTSTTKKSKSHKHKESSSTSTTPKPDDILSTETVTKKHHRHHHHHHRHNTSTTAIPSTTMAHESYKDSKTTLPMNGTNTDGNDDHNNGNKTDHKSSLEIIESFLASLGHKMDKMKDTNTSTEAPTVINSKTHKKKHRKSKHKKTSTVPPESLSTVKSEKSSIADTEASTSSKPTGDTTTPRPTSKSPSFPIISITRPSSVEKYSTTISSESHANSSSSNDLSKSNSTTEIPTLGPYIEELDEIIPTESIVYSDWNPDVFP